MLPVWTRKVRYPIALGYLQPGHQRQNIQATELVNELYVRLARQRSSQLSDSTHFYTFAAMLMRRILSDQNRRAHALKRPGSAGAKVPLHPDLAWVDATGEEMLSLDQALAELEAQDARKVRPIHGQQDAMEGWRSLRIRTPSIPLRPGSPMSTSATRGGLVPIPHGAIYVTALETIGAVDQKGEPFAGLPLILDNRDTDDRRRRRFRHAITSDAPV